MRALHARHASVTVRVRDDLDLEPARVHEPPGLVIETAGLRIALLVQRLPAMGRGIRHDGVHGRLRSRQVVDPDLDVVKARHRRHTPPPPPPPPPPPAEPPPDDPPDDDEDEADDDRFEMPAENAAALNPADPAYQAGERSSP